MQNDALQQLLSILSGSGQAQLYSPEQVQMPTMPQVTPVLPRPTLNPRQHSQVAQATSQAVKNGADPTLLAKAQQTMGKQDYLGLCEAFVERITKGTEGIYASAIDAWNKQKPQAQTDLSKIQPGDTVYFGADKSNGGYGHAGVYLGNNKMTSATYNGIKESDLNEWQNQTGQKILGFIPTGAKSTMGRAGI